MAHVVAQHAVLLRAQARDRGARGVVEPAACWNSTAMQPSVSNACASSSSLASVLSAGALHARGVPGVADLQTRRCAGVDVAVARAADDVAAARRAPRTAARARPPASRARRRRRPRIASGAGHVGVPAAATARRPPRRRAQRRRHARAAAAPAARVAPRSVGAVVQSLMRSLAVVQSFNVGGALAAVLDAALDLRRSHRARTRTPSTSRCLMQPSDSRVVERVDRVAVARAPEQARVLVAHHLPHRAAQALALRLVEHRELVEVGACRPRR